MQETDAANSQVIKWKEYYNKRLTDVNESNLNMKDTGDIDQQEYQELELP
jgi:hypothetical protein